MTKPVTIPNTFANATTTIPLSQLDSDFSVLASAINDPATYSSYAADTGTANTYVVTLNPAPSSLSSIVGLIITFKTSNANTGASTLNLNALGALSIVSSTGSALTAGQISSNSIVAVSYNGTNFTLIGASASATPSATGGLLNIQYFTTPGTATYTPTANTSSVIVEVVGGGGGSTGGLGAGAGTGGTSSFGALVSATGGGAYNSPGAGASGDLNLTGGQGGRVAASTTVVTSNQVGGVAGLCYGNYGFGASQSGANSGSIAIIAGAGGGAARKKITSSFSGVTVTVGAAGTAGTSGNAGNAGIVIVYEYA